MRTILSSALLVALAIAPASSAFPVAGFDHRDSPAMATERVTHRATSIVLGDRTPSSLEACTRTPATDGGGIFRPATDCPPSAPPTVPLLSMANERVASRGSTPLRIGQLTVLPMKDRTMQLRFTLGVPPVAVFAPINRYPWSEPLVSVGVETLLARPGE